MLLAGNVVVFPGFGGDVWVVGDGAANAIEIDQFGRFTVRGRDHGGRPTRVNGVPNGEVRFAIRSSGGDIKVLTNGGADAVRVGTRSDSVEPPDDLEISTGTGDDEVTVTGDTNVPDDLVIAAGSGNDRVDVLNADVGDDLAVNAGSGDNTVRLLFDRIRGDTTVLAGAGADRLMVEGGDFVGRFAAGTGAGNDFAELCESSFRGPVQVSLGDGDDGLCVGGHRTGSVFEDESVRFSGGAGTNDRYVIEFSTFAGDPLIGDLIDGFEFEVDDCTMLGGTCVPAPG